MQDMDLRAEKEKQRSALIKLQELSSADKEFADKCEAVVNKELGLRPPVLSRLEMQANSITIIGAKCHFRVLWILTKTNHPAYLNPRLT